MRARYFFYALLVTLFTTAINWGRMLDSSVNRGSGSSFSSHSYGGGSWGGGSGGHK